LVLLFGGVRPLSYEETQSALPGYTTSRRSRGIVLRLGSTNAIEFVPALRRRLFRSL
jgi:hypothetical protein